MSQLVNHFNIKRQAHHLSRQSTNAAYNPFAHFAWGRNRRAGTFPVDVEAQDEADNDGAPGLPGDACHHGAGEYGVRCPAR